VARGQWSSGKRDKKMVEVGLEDQKSYGRVVQWHQQEPASAGLDSAKATNDAMAEAGLTAHYEPVSGDKEDRAGPLSSKAEAGNVKLLRGPWNEAFLSEATAFPKGRHDDQVDAASTAYNKLRTSASTPLPTNQPTQASKYAVEQGAVVEMVGGSKFKRY
jgi:predicted phage terminase large subunit-like protein